MKEQQKSILEKLENEELSLVNELAASKTQWRHFEIANQNRSNADCYEWFILVGLPGVLSLQARRHPRIDTGIPEAAFELECPDNQLKASVLQEFILIDDKHSERLNEFEEKFESVLM